MLWKWKEIQSAAFRVLVKGISANVMHLFFCCSTTTSIPIPLTVFESSNFTRISVLHLAHLTGAVQQTSLEHLSDTTNLRRHGQYTHKGKRQWQLEHLVKVGLLLKLFVFLCMCRKESSRATGDGKSMIITYMTQRGKLKKNAKHLCDD